MSDLVYTVVWNISISFACRTNGGADHLVKMHSRTGGSKGYMEKYLGVNESDFIDAG